MSTGVGELILAIEQGVLIELAAQIALIGALVVLSGLFSASEAVLFSLTAVQLQHASASSNPFRRMAAGLMRDPKRTLMIVLLANTAVNVLLYASTYVFFDRLTARFGAWLSPVAGAGSVLLVLVFGEVLPKVIGVAMTERMAPFCAATIHFCGYVFGPISRVIDVALIEPLLRLASGRPTRETTREHDLSPEELKTLLDLSRQHGLIHPIEDTFLREVIDLSYLRVRDVMVPRVEVVAYDVNGSPQGLRELMRKTQRKKIPVFERTPDQIVGLVYAKVLFFEPSRPLRELVQPVRFVPELITCEQLLHHFRATRTQIAMVVDEFGGLAGLVTLQDVIEEIVGEIRRAEDAPGEPEINAVDETTYDVSGRLSVHYWAEFFGQPRLTEHVATVGGLVTSRLGRPARVGDRVQIRNLEFEVTRVAGRRVDRLLVRRVEEPAEQEAST